MKKIDIIDLSKVISKDKVITDIIDADINQRSVHIPKYSRLDISNRESRLDISKVKTIEDVKLILGSLKISFSDDIINRNPLLKKFIKIE